MKIYTKTGDKGQTSLFGGKRVLKSDIKVETYGTVDELNSSLGVVLASKELGRQNRELRKEISRIQNDLFELGSYLASQNNKKKETRNKLLTRRIEEFETLIDKMTKKLPPLSNFILPGGGEVGSRLHFCRTLARRAERRVVALSRKEKVDREVVIYLNRLSDLLFTMARFVNFGGNKKEIVWKRGK